MFNVIGPILTVGVPVALFLRLRLVTPFVVFVLELVFWLLVAIVSQRGDTPVYYLALVAIFVYLPLYGAVGGIEYYVRSRKLPSISSIL